MIHTGPRLLAVAMCALVIACDNDTSPSGPVIAGQWIGTTSQGTPIGFAVSPDEKVTTITVGHNFNGCSGRAEGQVEFRGFECGTTLATWSATRR